MKRFVLFCLALLCCVSFSGCILDDFSSSEREELIKSGEKIFKKYLSENDAGAKITEMREITYLGKNHQSQLTNFAEGKYRSGSETFRFAVDTKTGNVYTSRRQAEFIDKMTQHVRERLSLQWNAVKPDIILSATVPLEPRDPKKTPMTGEPITLNGMLPADIPDMDAYVQSALGNDSLHLSLRFLYTGKPLRPDSVTLRAADTFSRHAHIKILRLPDSLKEKIETVRSAPYGSIPDWPINAQECMASETVKLDKTVCIYRKWEETKPDGTPFILHYPAYDLKTKRAENGSVTKEEKNISVGTDLKIVKQGSGYEFVTSGNRPLKFYVFIENLSAVENVKEIAVRNRKFHDAAYNEMRWHPVLDRWTVGYKTEKPNQIDVMQQQDLIVAGKAALETLHPKKKEPEKK